MNSIEKLREFSQWFPGIYATENVSGEGASYTIHNYPPVEGMGSVGDDIRGLADEIEAEIAEKYIELPVDADGIPICVGEDVVRTNDRLQPEVVRVIGVSGGSVFFKHEGRVKQNVAHNLHHVKPRTIEDVLRDVWKEALNYANSPIWRNPDEVFAERADEIRELDGGGAMSGICDTCKRDPCHMRFDGCKTCDVYEGGESNYTRLFGTPERAARTFTKVCDECSADFLCRECPLYPIVGDNARESEFLEWLKGVDA